MARAARDGDADLHCVVMGGIDFGPCLYGIRIRDMAGLIWPLPSVGPEISYAAVHLASR